MVSSILCISDIIMKGMEECVEPIVKYADSQKALTKKKDNPFFMELEIMYRVHKG